MILPDLKNKTVLVTGATRGLGKAIAKSLAGQGAHVVFNYRKDLEQAEGLKSDLQAIGGKATGLMFDVTNTEQMKSALTEFNQNNDPISGLVNNAGISKDTLLLRLKEDELTRILDTNLKAAMLLTSILARGFLKAENVSIVNISSIVGLMGNTAQSAYAASKAGLLGFTKSVAKELGSRQIRCNAICPGFIESDMTNALTDQAKEQYLASIPLARFGSPDDVAHLTCFLLSGVSSYLTGDVLKIDGGLYI